MLLEGNGGVESQSSGASDQDPDELLAELVRAEKEGSAPAAETPAAPATPQGFEPPDWAQFEWNGKKIAPDSPDKAKTWISQGYNYSQRMGELNKQKAEAERLQVEWGEKIKRYEQIDGYIAQNPQWWDHVNQQWETRLSPAQQQQQQFQPGQIPQELQPILQPLLEKVSKVDEILAEREQEREAQALREAAEQERAANENLDKEIESIRKKYPNIDLASKDASEMTLETRVLRHANENSIPSFRAAFHDYMSDRLSELASANGREAAVKTRAEAAKKGILGTSPAPTKGITSPDNIKAKSNEDLKREALAELAALGFT